MANGPDQRPLIASILDRLTKEVEDTHESVAHHLEQLLNTRCRCEGWPADFGCLDQSVVGYGVPDFTGTNASAPGDVQKFLREIEKAIRVFEPRFKSVKVQPRQSQQPEDRVLRFRVVGELRAEPWSDGEVFDYKMEPDTGGFVQDRENP